jgi:hypothetical protein
MVRISMNIKPAFKNERLLKSLIGISQTEFSSLLPTFSKVLYESHAAKQRLRAVGGGRKGVLPSLEEKLFYILLYLKIYPTYDLAGFMIGTDRSRSYRWTIKLMPLLEKALGRACVLPARQVRTVEELLKRFPEIKDIFLDGTERRTQRAGSRRNQNRRYSGKQRSYTRKNILGVSENKTILLLSPAKNGRRHDKRRLSQANWLKAIPPGTTLWTDTGFTGIEQEVNKGVSVMHPTRRKPRTKLTDEQKQENRVISGLRMVAENAIAGIKRFNCLTHVYRNHKGQDDTYMAIASGLWNLHLRLAS